MTYLLEHPPSLTIRLDQFFRWSWWSAHARVSLGVAFGLWWCWQAWATSKWGRRKWPVGLQTLARDPEKPPALRLYFMLILFLGSTFFFNGPPSFIRGLEHSIESPANRQTNSSSPRTLAWLRSGGPHWWVVIVGLSIALVLIAIAVRYIGSAIIRTAITYRHPEFSATSKCPSFKQWAETHEVVNDLGNNTSSSRTVPTNPYEVASYARTYTSLSSSLSSPHLLASRRYLPLNGGLKFEATARSGVQRNKWGRCCDRRCVRDSVGVLLSAEGSFTEIDPGIHCDRFSSCLG